MSKKHIFLSIFSKITIFACVFCTFFISPVFATLPTGYTELEYIESTGTQYIDTGFTWETSTKIDFTIERLGDNAGQTTGTSRANVWFGANGSTSHENMLGWGAAGNSNYFRGGTGGSYYVLPLNTKTNITFDYTKGAMKLFVNGVQNGYGSTRDTVITSKILLGGVIDIAEATPILFCLERFYGSVKLWNGGTLVADFIPAKRDSDGEIGMYDIAWDGTQYGVVDLGTLNWSYGSGAFQTRIEDADASYLYLDECYSSKYIAVHGQSWDDVHNGQIGMAGKSIRIKDSSFGTDTTAFKQAMSGVYLYYQRTTDTEFHGPFYTNSGAGTFIAGPVIIDPDSEIKIATTKMVDDEFAAAEANLAATVQTIESVVSRTIAQTGQIQVLQDTKQTRPDENCPANMKCLLVQDEDGTPHWYPIIEP